MDLLTTWSVNFGDETMNNPSTIPAPALQLADVAETGLLTLYCRAKESLSANPILQDDKAVEITRSLNPLLASSDSKILQDLARGRINPSLAVHIALRARQYDQYAREFLARHPDGAIVNIGCGLDSRYIRIGGEAGQYPDCHFFDLDLPEVMRVKERFFQTSQRYHLVGCSVFESCWMEVVQAYGTRPVLFLAEGVFMYLDADKVRNLILTLQARFPGAEMVFEVVNQRWLGNMSSAIMRTKMQGQLRLGKEAVFHFGVTNSRELEAWQPGIEFLEDWCYFDTNHPKLGLLRWFGKSGSMRHVQWTVRYRLNQAPAHAG